jgi:hypothetical protein
MHVDQAVTAAASALISTKPVGTHEEINHWAGESAEETTSGQNRRYIMAENIQV